MEGPEKPTKIDTFWKWNLNLFIDIEPPFCGVDLGCKEREYGKCSSEVISPGLPHYVYMHEKTTKIFNIHIFELGIKL